MEERAQVAFSPLTAAVTLTYTVGASLAWYGLRKAGYGFGKTEMVVVLYWLGAVVFFGALWLSRGVAPWKLTRATVVVTVSMLVFLSVFWLYGRPGSYHLFFGPRPPPGGLPGLYGFFFFVGASVLCRIALPIATGRLVLGWRPRDFGYQLKGAFRLWWIYLILTAIVVPAVAYASTLPVFLRKYPWCKGALIDGTIEGQVFLLYAASMVLFYASGEAFWRGWLLLGTEKQLGRNALFLMLMPYVLGHLGKPLAETLGAVAAGLVLGGLALYHRSFWLGALCHWSVAMTMDLFALWRRGVTWVW